ncbi:MAG: tRNA (adenosine(37)-N6)-threonylcarbamoyltransferase complex dimerization subunit type 1 TsaB [Bdellovibrionales bacterium]
MFSLAIDTSSSIGSVAVFEKNIFLDQVIWEKSSSHSESIATAISSLLKKNKIDLLQIRRIGVCIGPGSFTGIRVGINCARALGFSLKIPVFSMSSLQLLASQTPDERLDSTLPINVLIYGFRDILYSGIYKLDSGRVNLIQGPVAITISQYISQLNSKTIILGTGYQAIQTNIPPEKHNFVIHPTHLKNSSMRDSTLAQDFLNTGLLDLGTDHLTDWIHTIPLYIRKSEAEEKIKG